MLTLSSPVFKKEMMMKKRSDKKDPRQETLKKNIATTQETPNNTQNTIIPDQTFAQKSEYFSTTLRSLNAQIKEKSLLLIVSALKCYMNLAIPTESSL